MFIADVTCAMKKVKIFSEVMGLSLLIIRFWWREYNMVLPNLRLFDSGLGSFSNHTKLLVGESVNNSQAAYLIFCNADRRLLRKQNEGP